MKIMTTSDNIEEVETIYGVFLGWKDDLVTQHLKDFSAHCRNELAMLGSLIKEGDNVLDIGAHIGTFSIPFARHTKERGAVYSFEANPNNYKLLLDNIQNNDLSRIITPTHAVVSCEAGAEFEMSLPGGGNSGMYRFLPVAKASGDVVASLDIDDWYAQRESKLGIQLIKIDVEGAEYSVLRSCQEIIRQQKPAIYIEIYTSALQQHGSTVEDIEAFLDSHGYHYFRNTGPRNSATDVFEISALQRLADGGEFFDLLAIHPCDARYPHPASSADCC